MVWLPGVPRGVLRPRVKVYQAAGIAACAAASAHHPSHRLDSCITVGLSVQKNLYQPFTDGYDLLHVQIVCFSQKALQEYACIGRVCTIAGIDDAPGEPVLEAREPAWPLIRFDGCHRQQAFRGVFPAGNQINQVEALQRPGDGLCEHAL